MMGAIVRWVLGLLPGSSWLLLILLVTLVGGQWISITRYDRALTAANEALDAAQTARDQCRVTRSSLELEVQQQNAALQDLRDRADARQAQAAALIAEAQEDAQRQYRAAQELLLQRTGGDDCAAAARIIDEVLGL